jgi:SAM-dependent methyltransferase
MELRAAANGLRVIETRVPGNTMDWERIWTGRRTLQEARFPGTLRIAALTRKFLPAGARVLDGGCGLADKVLAFDRAGLEGYGVDTAQETLARAKDEAPSLRVFVADVRALPFPDNSLDGYWSLGVLEHFFDGFDVAAAEIRRTLKPGGYLFLSVPSLNVMKSRRLARGAYAVFPGPTTEGSSRFWQYYFSYREIIDKFAALNFSVVDIRREGAYYGIKNDISALRPVLQAIENGSKPLSRLVIRALNLLFNRWAFHTTVYVLRYDAQAASG